MNETSKWCRDLWVCETYSVTKTRFSNAFTRLLVEWHSNICSENRRISNSLRQCLVQNYEIVTVYTHTLRCRVLQSVGDRQNYLVHQRTPDHATDLICMVEVIADWSKMPYGEHWALTNGYRLSTCCWCCCMRCLIPGTSTVLVYSSLWIIACVHVHGEKTNKKHLIWTLEYTYTQKWYND